MSSLSSGATPTPTNSSHQSSHESSLSSGSIAGIVVAAIFGPMIVLAVILILARKRVSNMIARARQQKGSLDWASARNNRKVFEADGSPRAELDGKEIPTELATNVTRQELPARSSL